jgi:regulatory protein YycI of two-component signal transduction system YycFG
MDWGRAKSVLIFSFLLLNVLLGYQLWLDVRERLNTNVDLTDFPPETLRLMQEKNIRLPGSIPSAAPELKDLFYRFVSEPDEAGRKQLKTPVDSKIVYLSEQELQDGLKGEIPELDKYSFDPAASSGNAFVFYRLTETFPIFDVKLELYYSNQKIIAYHQDKVEIVSSSDTKGQAVLSASKAIASLVEKLPAGSVIKEIRLGYHGQRFDSEDQVAAPSWRVILEDGTTIYMNAISGEVMPDQDKPASGTAVERTGQS